MKLKLLVVLAVLIVPFQIVHAVEKVDEINPLVGTLEHTASVLGMSKKELQRAFEVIHSFQSQKLTLPQLVSVSDDDILASIDMGKEPYVNLQGNEWALVTWKSYEIETQVLAERADVAIEKFRPFYHSFARTMHLGVTLLDRQIELKYKNQSAYNTFDDDDDPIIVECNYSCDFIDDPEGNYERIIFLSQDMSEREAVHGYQSYGTQATIVNPSTSEQVTMERKHSSVAWQSIDSGSSGGDGGVTEIK